MRLKLSPSEARKEHLQYDRFRSEIEKPGFREIEYVHLGNSYPNFVEEITIDDIWLYRTNRENGDHNKLNKFHIYPKYYD